MSDATPTTEDGTPVTSNPTVDPVAPEPEADPTEDAAPAEDAASTTDETLRRPRGTLEADVKEITDLFVQGALALPEGVTHLTPHFIGQAIKNNDSLEKAPSTGAVAAVLNRWEDCGYALLSEKPRAFVSYTEAARTQGLQALKDARKTAKSDARKAAKAAEAAAAAPAEPAVATSAA